MAIIDAVDNQAVKIAAQNIADWFGAITPDELAEYGASGTDVAGMLPMILQIPGVVHTMSRWTLVPYLRGIVRSARKAELYERIMMDLAEPMNYGGRFYWHVLVMCHGLYPAGSPMAQTVLHRFPVLVSISSLQGWYHANMDRIVQRLIDQLADGGEHGGPKPADGDRPPGGAPDSGGPGDGDLLPGQAGIIEYDLAGTLPFGQWDGGYGSDPD